MRRKGDGVRAKAAAVASEEGVNVREKPTSTESKGDVLRECRGSGYRVSRVVGVGANTNPNRV
jgi:hypothetical protein